MTTLSIRLDDNLGRELDLFCKREGYKKSGLLIRLLREFLGENKSQPTMSTVPTLKDFSWEGKLTLGGNALEDTEKVPDL